MRTVYLPYGILEGHLVTLVEIGMQLIYCNPGRVFVFLTGSPRIAHFFSDSLLFQRSMILETCTSASDGC